MFQVPTRNNRYDSGLVQKSKAEILCSEIARGKKKRKKNFE